jgi:hypothetical protein
VPAAGNRSEQHCWFEAGRVDWPTVEQVVEQEDPA